MIKYTKFIGIVILIIIFLKIDINNFKEIIINLNLYHLLFAIFLFIPHLFLKSFRWNYMLRIQGIKYSISETFIINMSALYIGFITPGRLGEFVKVIYVKNDKNVSYGKSFSSVLMDRIFDLALLILLSLIGMWNLKMTNYSYEILVVIFFTLALALFIIILNKKSVFLLLKDFLFIKRLDNVFPNVKSSYYDFKKGTHQLISYKLIIAFNITVLAYVFLVLQSYELILSMGLFIDFISIAFFMAISSLVALIPISFSGLGTREATLVYLFSHINFNPENAIIFSFLIFFTFYVFGGVIGYICYSLKPIKF